MARPKEFDKGEALDAAIGVFCEHGYAGTSATMLTSAMKIGRQSLYDTFVDKWQLYCAALRRYGEGETQAHITALRTGPKAIDGIYRMMGRVVRTAHTPCLGVGSISEFGDKQDELNAIRAELGMPLSAALIATIAQAQADGDAQNDADPKLLAAFLLASIAALRISARGGAGPDELESLGQLALRALR
ncbi:TetR/AcrR family transcriptional regulator [Cupriavidus agavae]|uniref:TetR family transcriptional regulator n=1 Tax=Cupriavidus agavae TaxID=1001822 RepID=A0A4Q7R884_9BURK|nr:TetR/AcrR family transcriptional regulator [Cupriavidus agavae]RZT29016.1 TetR family transcriptional regulator [Cupriavidus agavae]